MCPQSPDNKQQGRFLRELFAVENINQIRFSTHLNRKNKNIIVNLNNTELEIFLRP